MAVPAPMVEGRARTPRHPPVHEPQATSNVTGAGTSYRLGIRQSMSRKGNCLDNAATEQVFGHLKDEFYRGREFDSYIVHWTPDDARYDSRDAPRRSS